EQYAMMGKGNNAGCGTTICAALAITLIGSLLEATGKVIAGIVTFVQENFSTILGVIATAVVILVFIWGFIASVRAGRARKKIEQEQNAAREEAVRKEELVRAREQQQMEAARERQRQREAEGRLVRTRMEALLNQVGRILIDTNIWLE